MPAQTRTYRVYCYDGELMTLKGHALKARTDEEAIAEVRAGDFGSKCEIWDGKRLVASLEAERQTS